LHLLHLVFALEQPSFTPDREVATMCTQMQASTTSLIGAVTACLAMLFSVSPIPAAEAEWKVGLAQAKITPEQPIFLAGYGNRNKPFEKVEADLYAKALALEDREGRRLVVVTTDLLGFPAAVAEPICDSIREKTGLKREQILLNSSHTHTGPMLGLDVKGLDGLPPGDAQRTVAYTRQLQDKVVDVVVRATASLEPAQLSWGTGVAHFVMNRREFTPNGVILGVNPRGLADRTAPVLRVDTPEGKLRAILFGAAVHGTTLTGNNYELCGDYAGFAQALIQEKHPAVQAMFMLGCAGDANPYPRGTMALAREHGTTLANEVCRVLDTKLRPVRGPLKVAFDRAALPLQEPPPRAELEKWLKQKGGIRPFVAKRMLAMLDRGEKVPASYTCPFAVCQLGEDLTLVGLPGEVVVDYAPLLEKALGPNRLWIAGYCNDVFGYLPSARVLEEGGYETRGLYSGGIGFFDAKAQDVVVAKVRELALQVGRHQPGEAPKAQDTLRKALAFHASFDNGTDADFARGDKRLYTASNIDRRDAKPGLLRDDVAIVKGKGRFGDALRFGKKSKAVVFFQADQNMTYRAKDWTGTVSFWLSLDPDKDLEPGFCDPIQITDKKWDDAALWVDFTKDDKPRHFRLGAFADFKVWNPKGRKFEEIPVAERSMSQEVLKPPFGRDKWTHVVMTFARFNSGRDDAVANLYLNGKLEGTIQKRVQTFTWDPSKAAIMLGLSYIGLFDDLAVFDRALTAEEVLLLHRLDGGVSALRR
jgi:hypothetical protein